MDYEDNSKEDGMLPVNIKKVAPVTPYDEFAGGTITDTQAKDAEMKMAACCFDNVDYDKHSTLRFIPDFNLLGRSTQFTLSVCLSRSGGRGFNLKTYFSLLWICFNGN